MAGPASPRLQYLIAVAASGAAVAGLIAFPEFFRRAPFLASGGATVVVLLFGGVGPLILTQIVTLLATIYFALPPSHSFRVADPGDLGRLALFLGLFALADLLAWRLERTRRTGLGRERALRESETRYRHLLEQASDGIVLASPAGQFLLVNQRVCEMLGYTESELLALPLSAVYAPGELEAEPMGWEELGQKSVVLRERRLRRKDGSIFFAELSVRRTADGLAQAIVRDITDRRRAVEALRSERDLLDGILATSVAGILVVDLSGRVVFANPQAETVLGLPREELIGLMGFPDGWRLLDLDGTPVQDEQRATRRVLQTGEPLHDLRFILEVPYHPRRVLSINAEPLKDASGAITAGVLSIQDITAEQDAQRGLREREEQLQRITSAVPGVVYQYIVDPEGNGCFAFVSERARELLGVDPEEIREDATRMAARIDPDDLRAMGEAFQRARQTLEPVSLDFRIREPGDHVRWFRAIATAIPGRTPGWVTWNGVIVEITERKRLEEELLQSQKMESLGRLAGGVAHDFNNLLTVIRGYADVLSGEFGESDPRLTEIREIRRAADRATALTRQLLMISRRQVLLPREVDLNALVQEMGRMLRRVLGEDIDIVTAPGADLGLVRADPGQLEQVILNLAVNARDAMPAGGALTIETGRMAITPGRELPGTRGVPPGDYIVLRVGDTGVGISREVQTKIFEPFFTTKPVGEGTGLGLSTVYGIVQQSNGVITVDSEPGSGTSFRIFLPRLLRTEGARPEVAAPRPAVPVGERRATVLLVEDDDSVRQLTRRILEQFGFLVREARNGAEALTMIDIGTRRVDAVVSDVVMPGMGGRELIGRLRVRRPELPVLFLSGYTREELSEEVQAYSNQAFLQKPYSPDALATALEELLADTVPPPNGPATAG
jgi:two-component system cell cycle sensor histidine kinase/response regulator CckA